MIQFFSRTVLTFIANIQLINDILITGLLFYLIKNKIFNFSLKFKLFLIFLILMSSVSTIYEFNKNWIKYKVSFNSFDTKFVNKKTDNLVIVVQGSAFVPNEDLTVKNKNLVDNHGARDFSGLGIINDKTFTNTQVFTYSGSHDPYLTVPEIINTIYYFKQFKPIGKVIIIGHSIGAINVIDACEKLKDFGIQVNLIITMDPAKRETYSTDIKIPNNVKEVINYSTPAKGDLISISMSGGVAIPIDKSKTKVINYLLPECNHTSVDNTLTQPIIKIINYYINNNTDPIMYSTFFKKLKIYTN
jgi:hypothetical protein